MRPTRPLAVGITPMETRRNVVLHVASRAEELGYIAVFVGEGWGHDVSVLLAEIAVRTSRISLGTGVINVWGRTPATIAMLATSLDELSGGRFVLGLGAGSPPLAEGLHDVPFHRPVERLGHTTRQVRRLLAGERIEPSVPGRGRPLRLGLHPSSPVPIQLAALGTEAIRLAGELADAWFPFLVPLSGLKDKFELLEDGAARGRRGSRPQIRPAIPVAVSPDPATARELASWWVTFYMTSMGPLYPRTLRNAGFGEAVDAVLATDRTSGSVTLRDRAEVLLDELTVWGDPVAAGAALNRWYDAGAEMPVLVLPPGRNLEELDEVLETMRPSSTAVTRCTTFDRMRPGQEPPHVGGS
jgi:alkanesulfonate monooxygenase SsuD/methylene tetrahydromethanopterin reductase-like flavin-dependent oxidoreductase (luciferase family)